MALYRYQIILNMDDGLAENAATNTLYFDADTENDALLAKGAIDDFYTAIDSAFSSLIEGNNCRVQIYRMSDPTPRQPIFDLPLANLSVGSTAGPTEVALVMSYQGARVSGLPQNRRRGRIYLGPLVPFTTARPDPFTMDLIRDAAQAMLTASEAAAGWTWAQYSPTNGVGIDVDNGWVDNEFDTQRRRGRKATQRDTFSV